MNPAASLRKLLVGSPIVAATAYVALVIVLLAIAISSLVDMLGQRASVLAATAMLEQLEGRKPLGAAARSGDAAAPAGSAFLEGATVTVAGAALLQRVAGAVTKVGGNMLSSQLDLQGPHAKAGFVSMVANCELEQSALQSLLYDLEAGMPFLFIDQLDIQVATAGEGKLRFLLGVSGQWQGAK
ncbi:MAG: type II secretion system protein GspM [Bradyrhizobium sp.]|uniref:type II secretion system protein GspM n=1 Tax=Bradyrhizobium sp. TaxID=376 RepID=UPI003BC664D9